MVLAHLALMGIVPRATYGRTDVTNERMNERMDELKANERVDRHFHVITH